MISRRALLSAIASLPFLRHLKPKPLGPVVCEEPPGGGEPVEIDYLYLDKGQWHWDTAKHGRFLYGEWPDEP